MLNIVVVGGGFGGIYTLIELLKNLSNKEVEITLFNKSNYFLFTPLLHEVATGGLNPTNVAEGIREIIKSPKVEFVEKMVDRIDLENKKTKEEIKKCLRIWPQDNDTEGFFVMRGVSH